MPWINTLPFDLNRFWEKTPVPLKYFLLAAVIFVASYILFYRTGTIVQINKIQNIQTAIDNVYIIVDNIEKFQIYQMDFNKAIVRDINNLYAIVDEINYNTNEKIGYVIKHQDEGDDQLILKINLLDLSFSKLMKAYLSNTTYPEIPEFTEYKKK